MTHSYANRNRRLVTRYDEWMVAQHYTVGTRQHAQRTLGLFNKFLGKRSIACVTHLEIREFLTDLSRYGATAETVYRHLGALRRFFDFLNLGGVVSYVAPRLIRLKQHRRTDLRILSEVEVKRLLAATQTSRERAIIEFIYGTGCRLREATHLRIEDINFENKTALVHGKFGKDRTVCLPIGTIKALRMYLSGRTVGYVFREDRPPQNGCLSKEGGHWIAHWVDYGRKLTSAKYNRTVRSLGSANRMSRRAAHAKFKKILEGVRLDRPVPDHPLHTASVRTLVTKVGHRVGLKNVGIHALRRSFATHLYDRGTPIEIIQALLGHVYLGTTLGYTRLSRHHLAKAIDERHPLAVADEE